MGLEGCEFAEPEQFIETEMVGYCECGEISGVRCVAYAHTPNVGLCPGCWKQLCGPAETKNVVTQKDCEDEFKDDDLPF